MSYYVVAVSRSRRPTNRKLPLRVATIALNQRKFRENERTLTPRGEAKRSKFSSLFDTLYILIRTRKLKGGRRNRGVGSQELVRTISVRLLLIPLKVRTTLRWK